MSIVIFDVVRDGINGYMEGINKRISEIHPEYSNRYGLIGSEKWLKLYTSGKISLNIKSGQISYIGPDRDEPSDELKVIEILTDRRMISYDQEGYWCNSAIQLGAWVQIETIKIILPEKHGPVFSHVDVRAAVLEQ